MRNILPLSPQYRLKIKQLQNLHPVLHPISGRELGVFFASCHYQSVANQKILQKYFDAFTYK